MYLWHCGNEQWYLANTNLAHLFAHTIKIQSDTEKIKPVFHKNHRFLVRFVKGLKEIAIDDGQ